MLTTVGLFMYVSLNVFLIVSFINVFFCSCPRGARGARAAAGAGAGCWGDRRARNMFTSIKGFWKVCRYGDLYMVTITTYNAYAISLFQVCKTNE